MSSYLSLRPSRPAVSRLSVGLLLALAVLIQGLGAVSSASASGPATVTVRVAEGGPTYRLVVPLTQVTTASAPLVKDGGSCSGTSAAGALEAATAGNWEGSWNASFGDYEVLAIHGLSYPFEEGSQHNYYWSFWLDNKEASTGICGAQLEAGDQLLFFPACYGSACPAAPSPLGVQAPTSAAVGTPVVVSVSAYKSDGEAAPVAGATVSGGGISRETDANGHATMTFSGSGTYSLYVTGSYQGAPGIPAEAPICVHDGNDGTCGTTAPSPSPLQSGQVGSSGSTSDAAAGPYAVVARASGLREGHVYTPASAPRVLAGKVIAHTSIVSVEIELRRRYHGRCFAYDGKRERFERRRCGHGSAFAVASGASFSYLLPRALPPGRYVYDIEATDAAGHRTRLARGSSRIVFYVR